MNEMLKRLIAKRADSVRARDQLKAQRKAIADMAKEELRDDLLPEEDAEARALTAKIADHDKDIASYDERIKELSEEEEREGHITEGAAAVRRAQARSAQVSEQATYTRGNGRSYLRDLALVTLGNDGAAEAQERLSRHAQDVRSLPEYRAGLDRTDTNGGSFVPPKWMIDQYVALARSSRPTADAVTNQPLPAGTDSMVIPRVTTGNTVGNQDGDNTAVTETDLVEDSITIPVKTIAGQETVSQQLIDQSPINFDEVIFKDLLAALATKVDTQVISGTNANGQVKGILGSSGIIAITYTDTTPSVQELYGKLADGIQRIHTQRFQQPTVIVMHPRRWAWLQNSFDLNNRPLVVPSGPGSNALATFTNAGSQVVVGELLGVPVLTDPNIPTNLGTGTNEDRILIMKADDLILWESSVRTRALPEVKSATLSVVLQAYSYIAFTAERQPKSVCVISGTGLVAPTF